MQWTIQLGPAIRPSFEPWLLTWERWEVQCILADAIEQWLVSKREDYAGLNWEARQDALSAK